MIAEMFKPVSHFNSIFKFIKLVTLGEMPNDHIIKVMLETH